MSQLAKASRSTEADGQWRGAAVLSRGFRPFFLAAGVWALIGMALWPPFLTGEIAIPTAFSPVDWHAHEMLFGYGAAVVAGFLLTAIPNWTGRLPVAGPPLAALWVAGRVAMLVSAKIDRLAAAAIDVAFLSAFAIVVAREVISGRNWRNLKVAVAVLALAGVNFAFHLEDMRFGIADYSARAALGVIVLLILLIGARVTPSFTRNWIATARAGKRPARFGKADGAVLALSVAAVSVWVTAPEDLATGRSPPALRTSGGCHAGAGLRPGATRSCSFCTLAFCSPRSGSWPLAPMHWRLPASLTMRAFTSGPRARSA